MADCICVNTLSELATTPIPTGTQAAVVNQFNSTSAVSAAVYILVPIKPGHPLSIQSPGGTTAPWWTIHPDYVSLEAAGAPTSGDCAPAFANVLLYFAATARLNLNLWARDYLLNSISTLPGLAPANSAFAIVGRGQTASRLIVPYPTNTSGALALTFPDTSPQFLFRDFSVIATTANPQVAVSCGTAILMNVNIQGANLPRSQYGGIVERLHIGPEIDPTTRNGAAYFSTGLNFYGISRPLVSATTISGCDGPITDDYSDSSPRYAMQTGIVFDECYSPVGDHIRMWHATTGVSYNCQQTNAQGLSFTNCNMEGVRTGIYVRHTMNQNPSGMVAQTSIQFRDIGLDMGNISTWNFPGMRMFLEGDIPRATPAYDLRFVASSHVTVTGATFGTFCGSGNNPNCGYRVNIYIDADDTVDGQKGASDFLIDTCMFGDRSNYFGLSAIQTTASASNINIGASNVYNGQYTQAIVNDASGTATTLVGFPGGIVAPNGSILGSSPIPWSSTYNLLHYLLPSVSPANPPSGWVFFVNQTGELVALSSSGKTVILGTP